MNIHILRNILIFVVCLFPSVCFGTQLAYISCDSDASDSLSYLTTTTGTPSIVAGHTNNACRSSHNDDDSDADDFRKIGSAPSGNIYVRYWVKYEDEYVNTSSNVKLLWIEGSTSGHLEFIYSSDPEPYAGTMPLRCQLSGGGAGFDGGTDVVDYFSTSYTKGEWMEVVIWIQKSTGAGSLNSDGIVRIWMDDGLVYEDLDAVTGLMDGLIHIPGINGTSDQATGHGWWQIDEIELHDSIPSAEPSTAPRYQGVTFRGMGQ